MKKVYLIGVAVALGFTACGGSHNRTIEENSTIVDQAYIEEIDININCTAPATIDNYIELQKGDKIIKGEENSTISIYHDENSLKKICLEKGIAYIEREVM